MYGRDYGLLVGRVHYGHTRVRVFVPRRLLAHHGERERERERERKREREKERKTEGERGRKRKRESCIRK